MLIHLQFANKNGYITTTHFKQIRRAYKIIDTGST